MTGGELRGGRYNLRNATMMDLLTTAYNIDADTVFGGPDWLEFDRFEVVASAPPATSRQTLRLMLQSLLADRFTLTVHKDVKPLPGFVLAMGKGKPKLKAADNSVEGECTIQPQPAFAWRSSQHGFLVSQYDHGSVRAKAARNVVALPEQPGRG